MTNKYSSPSITGNDDLEGVTDALPLLGGDADEVWWEVRGAVLFLGQAGDLLPSTDHAAFEVSRVG